MKRRAQKGMVLGITIIVIVLLLVMGTAVATMGTGNLNTSLLQLQSERAYQVAEGGIELAINDIRREGSNCELTLNNVATRTYTLHNGDQAKVTVYTRKATDASSPSGSPVEIPKGYSYIVSQGLATSESRILAQKTAGAMCCVNNSPLGTSQAFCVEELVAPQIGLISAMDLRTNTELNGQAVVATRTTAAGKLDFGLTPAAVVISGNVRIPDGGDASTILKYANGHTFANGGSFQSVVSPFNQPKTNVPQLPPQTQPANSFSGLLPPGHYSSLKVDSSMKLGGEYVIDNLTTEEGAVLSVDAKTAAEMHIKNWNQNSSSPVFANKSSANHLRLHYNPASPANELNLPINSLPLCLVAPNAEVRLILTSGKGFGSICARKLTVERGNNTAAAKFYYDPLAAQPVQMNNPSQQQLNTFSNSQVTAEIGITDYRSVFVTGRQRF